MGMDELIATLEREAEERCDALLDDARREAERIRRDTDERLERRSATAARTLESELDDRFAETMATTRTRIRGALLRARRRVLDRVFRRASELNLALVESPSFLASVPDALRMALSCLSSEDVEVSCPPVMASHLRQAADAVMSEARSRPRRQIRVTEVEDAPAGFEARGSTTGVLVDLTVPTRLEDVRPELEMDVLQLIDEAQP